MSVAFLTAPSFTILYQWAIIGFVAGQIGQPEVVDA
jgi:hypothetical protein